MVTDEKRERDAAYQRGSMQEQINSLFRWRDSVDKRVDRIEVWGLRILFTVAAGVLGLLAQKLLSLVSKD